MSVIEMKRHPTPDMQAVADDIDKYMAHMDYLLQTLRFVGPVDKVWLSAAQNNLEALDRTLKLAVMDRG